MTLFVNNATKAARPTPRSQGNATFEQANLPAAFAEIGVGQELRGDGGEIERTNEQLVGNKATVFWDNLSNDGVDGELLREDYGSGRGASFQCSNIFSIFAVLVFLFALVDFIMGMDGRRRRRRRDVGGCDTSWLDLEEPPGINLDKPPGGNLEEEGPMGREANLAVALLWRGNLLSHSHHMDNTFFDSRTTYNTSGKRKEKRTTRYSKRREGWEDPDADGGFWCAATIRCKAAKSAASLGRLGKPHRKSCTLYRGIAQVAIAPPHANAI